MRPRWLPLFVVAIALAAAIAGCGEEDLAPPADPPILTGLDPLPKELATVELSPTPSPVLVGAPAGEQPVVQPTATPAPPRPTPSLTPYVGIFLGQPTSDSGEAPDDDRPTIAPLVVGPAGGSGVVTGGIGGATACGLSPAAQFAAAYNADPALQERLGCPTGPGGAEQLVVQRFERGIMIWRATRQIFALADDGQLWQVADRWSEGMPADDPAFSPPAGLVQPVRGFGLVWRTDQTIRDALGWGTQSEAPFDSVWQNYERGAMFLGPTGQPYAIFPSEGQHAGPLTS